MNRFIYISLFIATLFSCKKAEDRACVKSAGDEITVVKSVSTFDQLFLGPHLNFNLVQDTVEKVVITGGKNLLNFVEVQVENGVLTIMNKNKCNFLRSYKKEITVDIHLKNVINITFEGTKPMNCVNQLVATDLTLVMRDGAGHVNMNVNANSLNTVTTHGWCNYTLNGTVNFLNLSIRGNGFGSSNMVVNDSINVISSTSEDLRILANNVQLRAEISSSGNIGYTGTPSVIFFENYGTGELVDEN